MVIKRDLRFDIARSLCMIYVIGVLHLSQYLGDDYYLNNTKLGSSFAFSSLGVFSFISGYFIGMKYHFVNISDISFFYKKRLIRFYPLFFIATIALCLVNYNTIEQSFCALSSIGCFVPKELRPRTLWYISMLMFFYLITPTFIFKGKIRFNTMFLWLILSIILRMCYNIDNRLPFNLLLYIVGIIVARRFQKKMFIFLSKKKWIICCLSSYLFGIIILIIHYNTFAFYMLSFIGAWMLLSLSFFIDSFSSNACLRKSVEYVSYASMSFYLFHRLFYYFAMDLYAIDSAWGILLLLTMIVFPAGLVLSYQIQKIYDFCLEKLC